MRTAVAEDKQTGPRIASVAQHEGYRAAKAKQADLGAQREKLSKELEEAGALLSSSQTARVEADAKAILSGGKAEDVGRLTSTVQTLIRSIQALDEAARMQGEVVRKQFALASDAVMETLAPEYGEIRDEYSILVAKIDELIARRKDWIEKVRAAGVRPLNCGSTYAFGHIEIADWTPRVR
jgi:prophage DNA circulation protein